MGKPELNAKLVLLNRKAIRVCFNLHQNKSVQEAISYNCNTSTAFHKSLTTAVDKKKTIIIHWNSTLRLSSNTFRNCRGVSKNIIQTETTKKGI